MPSLTVENYVKAIYQICPEQESTPPATGQMAAALGVLPGTVTSMLKTLSESSLATYTPYEGVSLTPAGNAPGAARPAAASVDRAVSIAHARFELGRGPRRGRAHGTCGQRFAGGSHRTVSWAFPRSIRTATRSRGRMARLRRRSRLSATLAELQRRGAVSVDACERINRRNSCDTFRIRSSAGNARSVVANRPGSGVVSVEVEGQCHVAGP